MPYWIWILPALVLPYYVVNIVRLFARRLPAKPLRKSVAVTTVWLSLIQVALLGFGLLVWYIQTANLLIITILVVQLSVSISLLISTVNSWLHIRADVSFTPLADHDLPSVSVLVPARNETIELENCLSALVASDYPKLEIIALDDCSANRRTPEIIRGFAGDGVRFVEGTEPSGSMLPKNQAYSRLAEESCGEILIFVGVDVIVRPDTIRRLVEICISDKRDMLSLLPMRPEQEHRKLSFIQAMRYWWELGWPRRLFNRPPVLSTLWLIKKTALQKYGGFAAAKHMITPEAYFARELIKTDSYSFLRSTPHTVQLISTKTLDEQFATSLRVRYPQLHHRIEQVLLVSCFEAMFLILPFVFLPLFLIHFSLLYFGLNLAAVICISIMYYLIAIRTRLNRLTWGLLTAPVAFLLDIIILHVSMLCYEFGAVTWHERSLNRPMLEPIRELPRVNNG